jgi:hypothetical protein
MPTSHYSSIASGESVKLFDQTLSADATTIDTGAVIPNNYSVLEAWVIARSSQVIVIGNFGITFNGDTGANYDLQRIRAINASLTGVGAPAQNNLNVECPGDSADSGAAGVYGLSIPGYAQTTFHKACEIRCTFPEDTAANLSVALLTGRWRNTAAINRITITAASGDLRAGSRLLIYGR